MIALLTVLHSPFNDIALATLLRSPLFNCSNQDLLFFYRDKKSESWYEILINETNNIPQKLKNAGKMISQWREKAAFLPIHDILDKIYHETDIMRRYAESFPKHLISRAQNNLFQFLSLALQIDSGRYPSLGRFLAKLEHLKQIDASPDEATTGSDISSIRILTIHASKGLEAPIVFLADTCDAKTSNSKHYQPIVEWPQNSKAPTTFRLCPVKEFHDPSLTNILHNIEQKEQNEDANLLYVALTRARQAVYVSGSSKENKAKGWYKDIMDLWPQEENISKPLTAIESMQKTQVTQPLDFLPHLFSSEDNVMEESIPETEDSQIRGIIIHRALELLTQENTNEKNNCLKQLFNEFGTVSKAEIQEYFSEALNIIENPTFQKYFDPCSYILAYNELPLQTISSDSAKLGIIDRLIITDKNCYIVDYKTHADCNTSDLENIALTYRSQMNFYRQMCQNIWPGKNIKCIILFTRFAKAIEL